MMSLPWDAWPSAVADALSTVMTTYGLDADAVAWQMVTLWSGGGVAAAGVIATAIPTAATNAARTALNLKVFPPYSLTYPMATSSSLFFQPVAIASKLDLGPSKRSMNDRPLRSRWSLARVTETYASMASSRLMT